MAFPTASVVDTFDRVNENPIKDPWFKSADATYACQILSNQIKAATVGLRAGAYYNKKLQSDYEIFVDVISYTLNDSDAFGLAVLLDPTIATKTGIEAYIMYQTTGPKWFLRIIEWVNGTPGYQNVNPAYFVIQGLGLSRVGNVVNLYLKVGGSWTSYLNPTLSANSAGQGYSVLYPTTAGLANSVFDNFGVGPFISTGPVVPPQQLIIGTGVPITLEASRVYACPSKLCYVFYAGTVPQISNDGTTFTPLVNGSIVSAKFIQSAGSDTIISFKPLR